jgi:hypothetical protein
MTPLDLVVTVGSILDDLNIDRVLGGSLASSLVGEPRSTLDIDIAASLNRDDVGRLVAACETSFYVSEQMTLDAIVHHSSFKLLHYESGMKMDIFVLGDDRLDRLQLARRESIEVETGIHIWVGSPTDQVLRKLSWFHDSGRISDRRWRDVVAVLVVQGEGVDHVDLQRTADDLGLGELAARAITEAQGSATSGS